MINIKVDLTNINKRLDKMQDYFSVDKTESGKKFTSRFIDASVDIFQENSLLRMESNQPPGTKKATRGKRLSISRFAKSFTKNLFIYEKTITNDGIIIGIGINIPTGIIPPAEKKYAAHAGEFSAWLESLGIYNFAGAPAQNIFYMRHYGTGLKGILSGYVTRLYPNNMKLLGPSGALLSTDVVRYFAEAAVAEGSLGSTFDTREKIKKIKARLVKRNKITGEIISSSESNLELREDKESENSRFANAFEQHPFLAEITKQIAADSVDNFFKGNFQNVKLANGKDLLMWHPGVRPYDWFKDTSYGKTLGVPFQEDITRIQDLIINSHTALLGKI